MSLNVTLSEEELILNALARVKHPKGERDAIAHSQREMEAIRPILDTLRASQQAMAEAVREEAES